MKIMFELTDEQGKKLNKLSQSTGLLLNEQAQAIVAKYLDSLPSDNEFSKPRPINRRDLGV